MRLVTLPKPQPMSRECSRRPSAVSGGFSSTHWSVVLTAGHGEDARSREALTQLCQTYWYPLSAFVRRRGYGPEDAQDLTQAFFAHLLEHHALAKADRARGKFRCFLLASLRNFLINEAARTAASKRGGGQPVVPFERASSEARYGLEAADNESPDKIFERNCALALLEQVLTRLRAEQEAAGKTEQFEQLRGCLMADVAPPRYPDLASQLGLSAEAVRMAVNRLRRRYRELLRKEILHTVSSPAEVEEEIQHLFAVLGA